MNESSHRKGINKTKDPKDHQNDSNSFEHRLPSPGFKEWKSSAPKPLLL
jgi:hypothetical protein